MIVDCQISGSHSSTWESNSLLIEPFEETERSAGNRSDTSVTLESHNTYPKCLFLNAGTLQNKIVDLQVLLSSESFDIVAIAITETWFKIEASLTMSYSCTTIIYTRKTGLAGVVVVFCWLSNLTSHDFVGMTLSLMECLLA